MKKLLCATLLCLCVVACKSKYEKTKEALLANDWMEYSLKEYYPSKEYDVNGQIHRFSPDGLVYIYDSDGSFDRIFSYELRNEKNIKLVVNSLLFSNKEEEYTALVYEADMYLIKGGTVMEFKAVKDSALKARLNAAEIFF
jgi:antitoxin component YwqK of YwqJK toxin-antitoxin module